MQLVNEFSVDAPLDTAWQVLTDIPQVVACVPGAELESHDGDDFRARVGVKVGPVGLTLSGAATVIRRDDLAHEMVVRGTARDRRGNGSAEATVTMVACESPSAAGRSHVTVTTDLELGGRIAQFGNGVIAQVGNRIINQFVTRLNARIAGPSEVPTGAATSFVPAGSPAPSERMTLALTVLAGVLLGLAIGRTVERIG